MQYAGRLSLHKGNPIAHDLVKRTFLSHLRLGMMAAVLCIEIRSPVQTQCGCNVAHASRDPVTQAI